MDGALLLFVYLYYQRLGVLLIKCATYCACNPDEAARRFRVRPQAGGADCVGVAVKKKALQSDSLLKI